MQLSIGEIATRTEVKVPTIRYYEQIGLMPRPMRTSGKQRRYGAGEIARLNFIRHARELGLDIADIRELLALTANPEQPCKDADSIVSRHLLALERRIKKMRELRAELRRMVVECKGKRVAECRVIEVLADHCHCRHARH